MCMSILPVQQVYAVPVKVRKGHKKKKKKPWPSGKATRTLTAEAPLQLQE